MKKMFTTYSAQELQAYLAAWAYFATVTIFALLYV